MHSEKNDLNDKKSECYVKRDNAEGTFRLKTDKNKKKRCGGKKELENLRLISFPPFPMNLRKSLPENQSIPLIPGVWVCAHTCVRVCTRVCVCVHWCRMKRTSPLSLKIVMRLKTKKKRVKKIIFLKAHAN